MTEHTPTPKLVMGDIVCIGPNDEEAIPYDEAGWLTNQLGPGNNIGLRIRMISCENAGKIRLKGEQHPTFENTLPFSPAVRGTPDA
jgi:hypothetical protein